MHEVVLIEILTLPAERSRGRHNPRAVKRKMSNFPTRARAEPADPRHYHYSDHIHIVAPATPEQPCRKPPKAGDAKPGPAFWIDHLRAWRRSRLARADYCESNGLEPRAFNRWVDSKQPARRTATNPRGKMR
jgi:hypothetical protein